jgi:hypothetical protein
MKKKFFFLLLESVLLIVTLSLKKGVGFKFNVRQHNIWNKLTNIFVTKHEKHEKLHNAIQLLITKKHKIKQRKASSNVC